MVDQKQPEALQELQMELVQADIVEYIPPEVPKLESQGSEKRDALIRDLKLKKSITVDYLNEHQINFMNNI